MLLESNNHSWLNNTSRAGAVRIYACGQCSGGGTRKGSTSHRWLKQEAMTSISRGSSRLSFSTRKKQLPYLCMAEKMSDAISKIVFLNY